MEDTRYEDVLSKYSNPTLLKQGGQKRAYRVQDSRFGDVVLKIGQIRSGSGLERIRREVMVLQEIRSDYYPKNFDFQVLEGDRFLIVEEYIRSRPLSDCLNEFQDREEALALMRDLAIGLKILWDKKIVHRDIKPDNILITSDGRPKIIDLGIARLLDLESLTQTFAPRGPCTPAYAAPEQLVNRKAGIDHRTDQFPLGIILVQLILGGKHPFDPQLLREGESISHNILKGRWYRTALDEEGLAPIRALVTRLLGREPYLRYHSPARVIEAFDECIKVFR